MAKSLTDLLKVADSYILYLRKHGVPFNAKGFPLLNPRFFLDEWPECIVPYDFRKTRIVRDQRKTALCFYCNDKRIFPRLEKVFEDMSEYRKYMAVITIDLTVTRDMDADWQNAIMLIQQLFMAVLAVNGIQVVANLRTGGVESAANLESVPKGVMWATGFLGCAKETVEDRRFISSVVRVLPSKLIVYGPEDSVAAEKLNRMGVPHRRYDDYHKLSKCKRG